MLPGGSIDGPGSVENAEMNPHIYDEPFSRKRKSDFRKVLGQIPKPGPLIIPNN
jgi:hypothetical protein